MAPVVEAIVQVVRIPGRIPFVIGAPGDERRLLALLSRRLPEGLHAVVLDATAGYCLLDIFGPDRSDALRRAGRRPRAGDADMAPQLDLGLGLTRAVEGGEHGLDVTRLIVASDMAAHIYEAVTAAAVRPIGSHAFHALRLEAGRPAWGSEIDQTTMPADAGLSEAAGLNRAADAVPALCRIVLERADERLIGREPIRRDGEVIGSVVSGAFGHGIGRPVGFAFVASAADRPRPGAEDIAVDVEIAGRPGRARLMALPGEEMA
ncbi:MAG: glycine cleavage T C-terminal barrel domain-containing protein [Hyphomicrobiaceae bacterium]